MAFNINGGNGRFYKNHDAAHGHQKLILVHLQVSHQMRLLREALIAEVAHERLLAGVHQHVLVQLAFGGEGFTALIAVEVLLARVYFDMCV